jgi:hypothetical protein
MVGIAYSPNGRAHCQGCHCNIPVGNVRVSVQSKSPYQRHEFIDQYYHAECYQNRKDFTKFFGFWKLQKEDQKKYVSEKKKKELFPEDYMVDEAKILAAVTQQQPQDDDRESDAAVKKKRKNDNDYKVDGVAKQPQDDADKENSAVVEKKRKNGDDDDKVVDAQDKTATKKLKKNNTVPSMNITITGINHSTVRASPQQKVKLVREPNNVRPMKLNASP